jgi:hypothetical protein
MARGSRVRIEQTRPVRERAPGFESINQPAAFQGSGVGPAPTIVSVDGDYIEVCYEVAFRGATMYTSGAGVTVTELADYNAALAPYGLSFPGAIAAPDDNNWQIQFQMPKTYDNTRKVEVTLTVLQEAV